MNVTAVRDSLPKGDFSIMTEMLKKFLNFMNLTVSCVQYYNNKLLLFSLITTITRIINNNIYCIIKLNLHHININSVQGELVQLLIFNGETHSIVLSLH